MFSIRMRLVSRRHRSVVFQKLTAGCLSLFLAFSPGLPGYAFPQTQVSPEFPPNAFRSLLHLKLPEELGKAEWILKNESSPPVVLIQDAHGVRDAQRSIQQILRHLQENYGMKTVFLEGVTSRLDPTLFRAFPDSELLEKVFTEYLDRGELAGAVNASVLNPRPSDYLGMEDALLYEAGEQLYLQALQNRPRILEALGKHQETLEDQKKRFYSPELLEFDRKWKASQKAPASLHDWMVYLQRQSVRYSFNLEPAYPYLQLVFGKIRETPPSKELFKELQKLQKFLGRRLKDKGDLREFHERIQAYHTERISWREHARALEKMLRRLPEPIPVSGEFREVVRQEIELEQLQTRHFFEELNAFVLELKARLFRNSREKEIDRESRRLELLEKLANLILTREEWEEIGRRKAESRKQIGNEFAAHLAFYRNAEDRESAMFHNLLQQFRTPPSAFGVPHSAFRLPHSAILIAGGFHTEGLLLKLKASRLPCVLISPAIHTVPEEAHYEKLMQGDVSWKSYFRVKKGSPLRSLGFATAEQGRINYYEAFVRGARDRLLGIDGGAALITAEDDNKNQGRAVRDRLLGEEGRRQKAEGGKNNPAFRVPPSAFLLKQWRDRVLRELAAQNRITEAEKYTSFLDEVLLDRLSGKEIKSLRTEWLSQVERLIDKLQKLREGREWNTQNVLNVLQHATFVPRVTLPLQPDSSLPRSELRKSFVAHHLPRVARQKVFSREMEAGFPQYILEQIAERYGEEIADWVAQTNLTGGLGALMPDLIEGYKANGFNISSIQPLWGKIKNVPVPANFPKEGLGDLLRKALEQGKDDEGVLLKEYEIHLTLTNRFREAAFHRGSLAQRLFKNMKGSRKTIKVRVYQAYSDEHAAPLRYVDAFYEEDGKEIHLFEQDEVYSEDLLWRDVQLAVFKKASEQLILRLNGDTSRNAVVIDNEVFTSLPAKALPKAKRFTINHTVFRPGLYEPDEVSYELLEFPEWLRPYIIKGGKISIADYAAESYHGITGVGLAEHFPALLRNIFPTSHHKLIRYYDPETGRRSTNGVFLPRWQSHERRLLIQQYKKKVKVPPPDFDLPESATDRTFFESMNQDENKEMRLEFQIRNDFIKAKDVAKLLLWLRRKQKKTGASDWLGKTMGKYKTLKDLSALDEESFLEKFQKEVAGVAQKNEDKKWRALIQKYEDLVNVFMEDPISVNIRRQVPYKGPDKWLELLVKNAAVEALQQKGQDYTISLLTRLLDSGFVSHENQDREIFSLFVEELRNAGSGWTELLKGCFSLWRDGLLQSEIFNEVRDALPATQAVAAFRNTTGREILGGRTFDKKAAALFEQMKKLIPLLKLEDRITTIENYNYREAALLFQAASGGVMLSDEFLEASATSMMKVNTDDGDTIGPLAGANGEVWMNVDQTEKEVPILDEKGRPAFSYDQFEENLRTGKWKVINGRVVFYSPVKDEGGNPVTYEQFLAKLESGEWRVDHGLLIQNGRLTGQEVSSQEGGWRRPSAESLLTALQGLKRDRSDPATRRERAWNVLASSWKVNVVTSQAQAHGFLLEKMLEREEEMEQMLADVSFNQADAARMFNSKDESFVWRKSREDQYPLHSESSLAGMLDGFRKLRTWGEGNQRGKAAAASLLHHCVLSPNAANDQGDIFYHILPRVDQLSDKAAPVKKRLHELAALAKASRDPYEKLALSMKALDILDRYLQKFAGEVFESYLNAKSESLPPLNRLLQNPLLRSRIVRYLDEHPGAAVLRVSPDGLRGFVFETRERPVLVLLNAGARETLAPDGFYKALGEVYYDEDFARLLSAGPESNGHPMFQTEELNGKQRFRIRGLKELQRALPVALPEPGIQILRFNPVANPWLSDLSLLVKGTGEGGNGVSASALKERIRGIRGKEKSDFRGPLGDLASLSDENRRDLFGEKGEGIPSVMALVAALAPQQLEGLSKWNEEAYKYLRSMLNTLQGMGYGDFLERGRVEIHRSTRDEVLGISICLVVSPLVTQRLIVAVQGHVPPDAAKDLTAQDGKIPSKILDLGEEGKGLYLKRENQYEIRDVSNHRHVIEQYSGETLLDKGLPIGIRYDPENGDNAWRFQWLLVTEYAAGGVVEWDFERLPDDELRKPETIDRLAKSGSSRAIKPLIRSLSVNADKPELRIQAVRSLGKLKSYRLPPGYAQYVPDTIMGVITAARNSLGIKSEQLIRKIQGEGTNRMTVEIYFKEGVTPEQIAKMKEFLNGKEGYGEHLRHPETGQPQYKIRMVEHNQREFEKVEIHKSGEVSFTPFRAVPRALVIEFNLEQASLTHFTEGMGTRSFQRDNEGNPRPFTLEEILQRLDWRAEILLASLEPTEERQAFQRYYQGLRKIVTHSLDEPIQTGTSTPYAISSETIKGYAWLNISYPDLLQAAKAAVYFADLIPAETRVPSNHTPSGISFKKTFSLARRSGTSALARILMDTLKGDRPGHQSELFFLSGGTLGYALTTSLHQDLKSISASYPPYSTEWNERVRRYLEGRDQSESYFRKAVNAIYYQLESSGLLHSLQPGDPILVVDQGGKSRAFAAVFKYIVEKKSKEADKEPIHVEIFSSLDVKPENLVYHYGLDLDEAKQIVHRFPSKVPHPLRVPYNLSTPVTGHHLEIELETPEVLIGAYLRMMLIWNETARFYQELVSRALKNVAKHDSDPNVKAAALEEVKKLNDKPTRSELRTSVRLSPSPKTYIPLLPGEELEVSTSIHDPNLRHPFLHTNFNNGGQSYDIPFGAGPFRLNLQAEKPGRYFVTAGARKDPASEPVWAGGDLDVKVHRMPRWFHRGSSHIDTLFLPDVKRMEFVPHFTGLQGWMEQRAAAMRSNIFLFSPIFPTFKASPYAPLTFYGIHPGWIDWNAVPDQGDTRFDKFRSFRGSVSRARREAFQRFSELPKVQQYVDHIAPQIVLLWADEKAGAPLFHVSYPKDPFGEDPQILREFLLYEQFVAFEQLLGLLKWAEAKGLHPLLDIPFYWAKRGVEPYLKATREFFREDGDAGAGGQSWNDLKPWNEKKISDHVHTGGKDPRLEVYEFWNSVFRTVFQEDVRPSGYRADSFHSYGIGWDPSDGPRPAALWENFAEFLETNDVLGIVEHLGADKFAHEHLEGLGFFLYAFIRDWPKDVTWEYFLKDLEVYSKGFPFVVADTHDSPRIWQKYFPMLYWLTTGRPWPNDQNPGKEIRASITELLGRAFLALLILGPQYETTLLAGDETGAYDPVKREHHDAKGKWSSWGTPQMGENDFREAIARYRRLREEHPALSRSPMYMIPTGDHRVVAFTKVYEDERLLVLTNFSQEPRSVDLSLPFVQLNGDPASSISVTNLMNRQAIPFSGRIAYTLQPGEVAVLEVKVLKEPARSELRKIVANSLEELADTGNIHRHARPLEDQLESHFDLTVSTLRQTAPLLAERYAAHHTLKASPLPDLDVFENAVRDYLERDPRHELHFAWMMGAPEDAEVEGWLAAFLERIQELSRIPAYRERLSAKIALVPHVVRDYEKRGHSPSVGVPFFLALKFPDHIELIRSDSRKQAAIEIDGFLRAHPNAVYHGLSGLLDRQVRSENRFRQVAASGVTWREAFPLLTLLHFYNAAQPLLTPEELRELPPLFVHQGKMRFDQHLTIDSVQRDLDLRVQTQRLLEVMA